MLYLFLPPSHMAKNQTSRFPTLIFQCLSRHSGGWGIYIALSPIVGQLNCMDTFQVDLSLIAYINSKSHRPMHPMASVALSKTNMIKHNFCCELTFSITAQFHFLCDSFGTGQFMAIVEIL